MAVSIFIYLKALFCSPPPHDVMQSALNYNAVLYNLSRNLILTMIKFTSFLKASHI